MKTILAFPFVVIAACIVLERRRIRQAEETLKTTVAPYLRNVEPDVLRMATRGGPWLV